MRVCMHDVRVSGLEHADALHQPLTYLTVVRRKRYIVIKLDVGFSRLLVSTLISSDDASFKREYGIGLLRESFVLGHRSCMPRCMSIWCHNGVLARVSSTF